MVALVGTGWSYVNDTAGYVHNMTTLSEDLYTALAGFFTLHPEYVPRVYLFGESYAGMQFLLKTYSHPCVAYTGRHTLLGFFATG